ncbi:hypothetical protein GCM10020360_15920 [Nonlabens tegetincola]
MSTASFVELSNGPLVYGLPGIFTFRVEMSAHAFVGVVPVALIVDGVEVGAGAVISFDGMKYFGMLPAVYSLSAGEHTISARFDGAESIAPGRPAALPSVSEPFTVTVAQASTSTEIVSAPAAAHAFERITVNAKVTPAPLVLPEKPGAPGIAGTAQLLADGVSIAEAPVPANGDVTFAGVEVPGATTVLSVSYLGSASGNYAPSSSAPSQITVSEVETTTSLRAARADVRSGVVAKLTAEVRSVGADVTADPRGGIEILVDGNAVFTVPTATDSDGVEGDGAARFELDFDTFDLPLGEHQLAARFVPVPGFVGSTSAPTQLKVNGVETQLAVESERATGTPERPATVRVVASIVPELEPEGPGGPGESEGPVLTRAAAEPLSDANPEAALVGGVVQAFSGDAPVGQPVTLTEGRGEVVLAGLGVGTHSVELRFTPSDARQLASSATVAVTIASTPAPGGGTKTPGAGTASKTDALSKTGGSASSSVAVGAGVLLLGAAAVIAGAVRRRAQTAHAE